ncbi:caspase family protein [Lentzea californiensis]|uniref:caspase family protein n=1 Tax=Lentzea californiensis TaxID=438851 RepID=UPI0021659FE1|nr:caspase family protein [Lentzea californiensis]MCR3750252.1 Caspase domain-containing protein [Lentzea californiensis]
MARKALLIGSQVGLFGVGNDLKAMTAALERWDFTSTRCEGENASRAGILDEYERFIGNAREDDALVVYYSGHGGYAHDPELGHGTPGPGTLQFIVPTDFEETTEDDFRGITAPELSVLLARLTERTQNVTVVLDCCHSGHMSRAPGLVRSYRRPVPASVISSHVETLRREGLALDLWNPPGNPHAVRIVACAPEERACEGQNADGVPMGYLTDALTRTLGELHDSGLTASWATLVDRLRHRVNQVWAGQRPEIEGPARRIMFGTREIDPLGALPVTEVRGGVRIAGAALLGARPGDRFVVMPDDSPEPDEERKVGDVLADRVDAQAAYGVLGVPVPLGARAHLVHTALPPLLVHTDDPDLVTSIESVAVLGTAAGDLAHVRLEAGEEGYTIHDAAGPLHEPRPTIAAVVADLRRFARARALKTLVEPVNLALAEPVTVRFGRVSDGATTPLPRSGATIHSGQSICVEVRNDSKTAAVYVSLLDVGLSGQIASLYPASPSGLRLDPGVGYVFGSDDYTRALPGMEVSWPESVPATAPREETIVVLVSSEPTDTRVLEQPGIAKSRERSISRLERHLCMIGASDGRETTSVRGRPVTFSVHAINFDLDPRPAPIGENTVFEVDDRPSAPTFSDHGEVTLRLSNLVVHHNRASRGPRIRLDALVLTEDVAGQPRHSVHTERFNDVADGERLSLRDSDVFRGDAHGRLDVAIWISQETSGRPGLNALLPQGEQVSVDIVQGVLDQALGGATAVYRNSLTASAAAHRAQCFDVRAKDFSFRCTVSGPSEDR